MVELLDNFWNDLAVHPLFVLLLVLICIILYRLGDQLVRFIAAINELRRTLEVKLSELRRTLEEIAENSGMPDEQKTEEWQQRQNPG